jgi:radical SAM superfamily enzyme YgiQ (UPF0313 family)
MKPKVVLYNPPCVFWTMPLALLAIGSAVDRERFEVVVVDGRLEPVETLLAHLEDAVCLGVTVLTGAPLGEALKITRIAHARWPELPIIWGGWHPSLFPAQVVSQAPLTAAVVAQGEQTFAELLDRVASGDELDAVRGCWIRGNEGTAVAQPPRALVPLDLLPRHDYGLIDPERYFAAKKTRQLDYVTSQGCNFRCSFCADPAVFGRGWSGLAADRVVEETTDLWRRHRYTDLGLQDETFFTSSARVHAIVDGWSRAGVDFTWYATMRADQGRRLDEEVLRDCRRSGLRRVVLGLESGHQPTLDRIRKDISLDDVWTTTERLVKHQIGAMIGVIVGFPDEPEESVRNSLRVARELRAMSPDFEVNVFSYKPYPGNPLADQLASQGYPMPSTLEEWARFDYVGSESDLLDPGLRSAVESFKFFQRIGYGHKRRGVAGAVQRVAKWRVENNVYALPIERWIASRLRQTPRLS